MTMKPRYLILGASGFIGARLRALLGPGNTVSTYCGNRVAGGECFDAGTMRLADTVLRRHRGITHAFLLQGVTAIDVCARDPEGTARVNVHGMQRVIDDLVSHDIIPVFASSDAVFDGSRGMWTETDEPRPILTYGRHKRAVEDYLQEHAPRVLIVRLSKVLAAYPGANDMLAQWMVQLEAGATLRCAKDQIFSPVDIDEALDAIMHLLRGGHTGIFHVCAPVPVSRLALLESLLDAVRAHVEINPRIESCSISDFNFAEPRPLDTSMSARKLTAVLGHELSLVDAVVRAAAAARYAPPASQALQPTAERCMSRGDARQ